MLTSGEANKLRRDVERLAGVTADDFAKLLDHNQPSLEGPLLAAVAQRMGIDLDAVLQPEQHAADAAREAREHMNAKLRAYGDRARVSFVAEPERLDWPLNFAESLNQHLTGPGAYGCELCGAIFNAERGRARVRRKRGSGKNTPPEKVAIRCPACVREEANRIDERLRRSSHRWWDGAPLKPCDGCDQLVPANRQVCSDRCRMRVKRAAAVA